VDALDLSSIPGCIVTCDLDYLLGALDELPADQLTEVIGALETAKARAWARLTIPLLAVFASLTPDERQRLVDEARAGDRLADLLMAVLAPAAPTEWR
jgi:hypothetical protein